jgi:hypothetical protein
MALFTCVLHFWATWMAFKLAGVAAGLGTLLLPVLSWCYWIGKIPVQPIRSNFTASVIVWIVSACLMIAARAANRKFPKR